MVSEFPAGLSRTDIDYILRNDSEVQSAERVDGAQAMWRIVYSFESQRPVEILIDNGINEVYVQSLIRIDTEHIVDALSTLEPFAVVGLAIMSDTLFMRSGFFIEHSTIHALTNSYRAVALAYLRYQQKILA